MKKKILSVAAAACVCVLLNGTIHAGLLQQDMADRILRFHVLANSDEPADQALKLKVRDAVGVMMAEKMHDVKTLKESRQIVRDNLGQIEQTAARVVAKEGCSYPVHVALTAASFPEKTYGPFTFPAGEYEALRVVIGEGKGHNWWCVMYPNLCFSESMYEVDGQSGRQLREVLTGEEYKAVLEEGNYKVQFKILGFMNRVLE